MFEREQQIIKSYVEELNSTYPLIKDEREQRTVADEIFVAERISLLLKCEDLDRPMSARTPDEIITDFWLSTEQLRITEPAIGLAADKVVDDLLYLLGYEARTAGTDDWTPARLY